MMFSVLEKIMLASSVLGKCRVWPPLCDPIRFNFKRRKLLALLSTSVKSLLLGLLISLCFNLCNCDEPFYTDQFVLQINGPPSVAQQLAEKHGFIYLDQIFDNHYHVKHKRIVKRSILPHNLSDSDIFSEPLVNSLTQLKLKRRSKRDLLRLHSFERTNRGRGRFDDPKWTQMWYLNRGQGLDMNVQKVWEMNITGRGVVVTILDDGLENDHPDLIDNYDPKASYDVNNSDEDPTPRYDLIDSNRHGTRCAGEVAAMANNSNCAVGVAFHAKVGGVRMLDGDVTDAVEARSLSFNRDHIHIYSASWGPDDDGKTVDGPGELATKAFLDGVRNGRGGLGSIFIWASGNGGREHDNCNCDGYTNSIWTLSISSVTENGLVPWYSEACSSTLATTYSSGSYGERQIVTTDLHHSCTTTHTGTSASAPLAAGISALVLESNPKLTWRDMQHIVVLTSRPANLHAKDWKTNGVGRNVSHSFGYGLMDAEAMVKTAKDWVTVPDQKICSVRSPPVDKLIPAKSHIELYLDVSCSQVNYLEHVQTKVTLTATRRGDIHIYLTSPSGTKATLLAQRPMDNSRSGFQNWPFMSVHTWGENPNGLWKLEVHNEGRYIYNTGNYPSLLGRAYLKEWTLFMYGTTEQPDRRTVKPSKPDVHTTNTKPYFNDKLGNDLDKSFDDNSAANPGNSKISNSFTRKPYPIPGWSPRYQQKPLPSSLDKALKKPIGPSLDNNDISLLSSANQNTQHNSVLGAIHGTREDKSQESASGTNYKLGKSYNRGCVLKDLTSHCLECSHDMVLINGVCLESCPEGYFRSKISLKLGSESSICSRCHYSCKSCHGPADNNCSQCFPDAQLNQHGYCHARSLIQEILALERWYTTVTVVFFVLCFVILILVVYIVTGRNHDLICCIVESNRSEPFTYVDVPLKSDQNRRRSSSRKISAHDAREIIQLSKKILREETSEDDL